MGSLYGVVWLCFWVSFFICSAIAVEDIEGGKNVKGTVLIDGSFGIGSIDEDFICATVDWWPPEKCDYGICSWGLSSMLNLDLNNTILFNAIKAFSPLKLRLGGTLQDIVIYDVGYPRQPCNQFVPNISEMFGFTQGCLPMSRWDELNNFFERAGAVIIFGLNTLNGKTIMPDHSAVGPWDFNNAASLIRYTANKNYRVHGWELGNELSGNGVGTRITAAQYASDVTALYTIVHDIYKDFKAKPLVIAPGGFFDANWYKELVVKTPNSLNAVTHHIYNLGPGVEQNLVDKILDPHYLDGMANTFGSLKSILNSSATSATAWVGEAGGAWNSGHNLVTNAFVFSFWYLDQLGMAATYDTKTYCRQTLIGGNYGLLNTTNFAPNPDYYSALLWHRLMGKTVLRTNFTGTDKIRAYAHCTKEAQGITLLLINLDGNKTAEVQLTTKTTASYRIQRLKHRHTRKAKMSQCSKTSETIREEYHLTADDGDLHSQTTASYRRLKHRHTKSSRSRKAKMSRCSKTSETIREEYHLTANDGDLHSQTMLLNGKILAVSSSGEIPSLEPIFVNTTEPITVAPYSIVFAYIPMIDFPACK